MSDKFGYWRVGTQRFSRKIDALLYASSINAAVNFYYHNHIWENYDRSNLGKVSLQSLYKERALQLRDKYDYLILCYSGGADSHNILKTFLDNRIRLDEVFVKWPKPLRDGKLYTPNTTDISAKNFWSEWDFVLKPRLQWLAATHPEIKITLKDYTVGLTESKIKQLFDTLNFIRPGGMVYNSVISDTDKVLSGKSVAHIYGTDKPLLCTNPTKDKLMFFFSDVALDQVAKSDINPENSECFYWSPDMPSIIFEQSYKIGEYIKNNTHLKNTHLWRAGLTDAEKVAAGQLQYDLIKTILYDNWNPHTFQTNKPTRGDRKDKFSWFYESPEFEEARKIFAHLLTARVNTISDNLLSIPDETSIPIYKIGITPSFFVMNF